MLPGSGSPSTYSNTHNGYTQMYNTMSWHGYHGSGLLLPSGKSAVGSITHCQPPNGHIFGFTAAFMPGHASPSQLLSTAGHWNLHLSKCRILPSGVFALGTLSTNLARIFSILHYTLKLRLPHSSFSFFTGVQSAA